MPAPAPAPTPRTTASTPTSTERRSSSSGRQPSVQTSATASPPVVLKPQPLINIAGKQLYRMSDGRVVELPPDMTIEEAARLEAEARAALQRLGKGPPPKPVPDAKKLAKKEEKKDKFKPAAKARKGGKGRGKAAAKGPGAAPARLKVGPGKVAQYLAGKGAPILSRGVGRLRRLRQNEQTHDEAPQKLTQSEKAVVIPPSEGQSKSNAGQVTSVSNRPAPAVDEDKGKQTLQQSLATNVPRSIEDVDNFKRDKKAQHMGADVMKVVQGDKNAVTATFVDMEKTPPPSPPEHTPEALPPEEAAPPTASMNLGQGAIAPLQKEHTDLSNFTKEADGKLKEEGITQEQLDMVDSGDLATANKEKKGMEKTAKTEPLAVQKFAAQETTKVDRDLRQQEKSGRDGLKAKRKASLGATAQKQKGTKSALEKKREEVANKINGIYTTAQNKVKKKLADLETQSMKRFDDGNAKATRTFEDNVNRELDAFKDDRYSGMFGWARKAKDWLLGMDDLPAVKAIFERNRTIFVNTINQLVENISADNKRVIQECKDELTRAKKDIKDYVDKLGPDLKSIGKQAAEEMNGKLNELDRFVAKKEQELQDQLNEKQQAAIKAIDEKIEKMKEAMSGALAKLGKLLLWAAKKFFTWALGKFGFSLSEIESIINKGVAVLKAIFTQPIQFVKNLVKAASAGFKNFGKNFLKHLQDAVFEWLTGSLTGLVLPSSWDLKGILSVVFQMLGLTYQNIRAHLVKLIPEPAVKTLETSFTLVKTLITEGPIAAWEQLKEIAGEMKEAFIKAVKDWIKWKVVQKAIETVLSLFIPGAGIIRAIIAIYDTIVFFIQRAKDIMKMIGSFLGSIAEIAAGNIGAAAEALENGLARGLVLVIDFLARFLRLSGITAKIREAIQNIRGKVDNVLARVAKWVVDRAQKLGKFIVQGTQKVAQRVLGWLGLRKDFTTEDGQSHSLFFEQRGKTVQLIRASDLPTEITTYLDTLSYPAGSQKASALAEAKTLAGEIRLITRTPAAGQTATTPQEEAIIVGKVSRLSVLLRSLIGLSAVTLAQLPRAAWASVHNQQSTVERLSSASARGGSAAGGTSPEWEYVVGQEPRWVRMHLIPYSVGGAGTPNNWIPAPDNVNTSAPVRNSFEAALETSVRSAPIAGQGMQPRAQRGVQPNVVWAESKVTAYKPDMIDSKNRTLKFPDRVRLQFGLYRPEGNPPNWLKLTAPLSEQNVNIGPLPDSKIRLSYSSGTAMRASNLPHLTGKAYSNRLIDGIKEMRQTATFATWSGFKNRLLAATVNSKLIEPADVDVIVKDFEDLAKAGKIFLR